MKKVLTLLFLSLAVALFNISSHATPPDYFYLEFECADATIAECAIQNAKPFVAFDTGAVLFYNCDRSLKNWSCAADLNTGDGLGSTSGTLRWNHVKGSFTLGQGIGTLEGLHAIGNMLVLSSNVYALEGTYHVDPSKSLLTHLPCDPSSVQWIQPHGWVDHGGGNVFFHDGIDLGTINGGQFFSAGNGDVVAVELNTGKGWPGTNYRVVIKVGDDMRLDYHFEIGGHASEADRRANIFVGVGDKVKAGQHIGNLIYGDDPNASGVAHVHWGIYNGHQTTCPLNYFSLNAAQSFEALYDSGIEKRPNNRPDLCE